MEGNSLYKLYKCTIIGKKEKVLEGREMQNKNIIWNIIQGLKACSQEQSDKNLIEEIRSQ